MPYKDLNKRKEYAEKYRKLHKDSLNEQCRNLYYNNKRIYSENNKKYKEEHRDELKEKSKRYYNENKDEIRIKQRQYHKKYYIENKSIV